MKNVSQHRFTDNFDIVFYLLTSFLLIILANARKTYNTFVLWYLLLLITIRFFVVKMNICTSLNAIEYVGN